jgi:heat shock protein HslJ
MKSTTQFVALFLVAILIAGCTPSRTARVADTSWELVTLNGQKALPGVAVTLSFGEGGQLSGSDGCNRYQATYQYEGSQLTIKITSITRVTCIPLVTEQSQDFQAALAAIRTSKEKGNQLALVDSSGAEVIILTALRPAALVGTKWSVFQYSAGYQAVSSVIANTGITAVFGSDTSLKGNSGCNDYNTFYTLIGDNEITIQPASTTRITCTQPVMEQEQAYLKALEQVISYELSNKTLYLRSADGALMVSYQISK